MKRSLLACIAITAQVALAAPALTKSLSDAPSGVKLNYPAALVTGKEDNAMPPKGWRTFALLIEPSQVPQGRKIDALPRGEIPSIELIETTGLTAMMQIGNMGKPEIAQYRRTYGSFTGVKLPGAFAPFGDQLNVWIVRLDKDRALMVLAHKYYFRDERHSGKTPVNTPYEEWVDAMLGTLSVTPAPAK